MSILSDMFSDGVKGVVDSVGNAIDNLVTSDEEKLALKNELAKINIEAQNRKEELDLKYEEEVTKRWNNDNEHIITRLTRPLSFAWVIVVFTICMIGDSNFGFNVKEAYIPVIETLLTTMVIALFGSRGIEKVTSIVKASK